MNAIGTLCHISRFRRLGKRREYKVLRGKSNQQPVRLHKGEPLDDSDWALRNPPKSPLEAGHFMDGGGGGIRTHEGLSPLLVFKTSAFNRSATPPVTCLTYPTQTRSRRGGRFFEPRGGGIDCASFDACPPLRFGLLRPLRGLHIVLALLGSNPRYGLNRTLTFQASPFDHSGTSP